MRNVRAAKKAPTIAGNCRASVPPCASRYLGMIQTVTVGWLLNVSEVLGEEDAHILGDGHLGETIEHGSEDIHQGQTLSYLHLLYH